MFSKELRGNEGDSVIWGNEKKEEEKERRKEIRMRMKRGTKTGAPDEREEQID